MRWDPAAPAGFPLTITVHEKEKKGTSVILYDAEGRPLVVRVEKGRPIGFVQTGKGEVKQNGVRMKDQVTRGAY